MKTLLSHFSAKAFKVYGSFHVLPTIQLQIEWFDENSMKPNWFITLAFNWLNFDSFVEFRKNVY